MIAKTREKEGKQASEQTNKENFKKQCYVKVIGQIILSNLEIVIVVLTNCSHERRETSFFFPHHNSSRQQEHKTVFFFPTESYF